MSSASLFLSSSVALSNEGLDRIDALINSINVINNKLEISITTSTGAVGYAETGGVIVDGALDQAKISETMLQAYLDALGDVQTYDYAIAQNAQQLFTQEHAAAMYNLTTSVDMLADATSALAMATSVASVAAEADTKPEQVALQGMLATEEYSIQAEEVAAYNEALDAVEGYAQQAGAFLAAANNTELTASIDSYAAQGNFVVGNYTAIQYTQNVDEFVITWADDGYASGWSGYLDSEMKSAQDVYNAGEYILQYGAPVDQM